MAANKANANEAQDTRTFRPSDLANEIGVDPKRLRSYLRANHTRPREAHGSNWQIPANVAQAAREHFAARKAANANEADAK